MAPPRKLAFQYVRHSNPETLIEFLMRRFHYHTRAEWIDRIATGAVTIDGARAEPGHILRSKEQIAYLPPAIPEPPVDERFTVLYEDDDILAVSKSGNIPSTPSGKYWHNCLRHVLQRRLGLSEVHAIHRLDRETSGINLFAKNRKAAGLLGDSFHAGLVRKTYAAILVGHLPSANILVNAPLQPAGSLVSIKQAVHPDGRASQTRFLLRALLPRACLVDVLPETGRTHQIRAHAAFLGHPVWGDHLYGVPEQQFIDYIHDPNRNWSDRHLLHAKGLAFPHPSSGKEVVVQCGEEKLLEEFWVGG